MCCRLQSLVAADPKQWCRLAWNGQAARQRRTSQFQVSDNSRLKLKFAEDVERRQTNRTLRLLDGHSEPLQGGDPLRIGLDLAPVNLTPEKEEFRVQRLLVNLHPP